MANRTVNITVDSQYFDVTGYTYYGYDSGPNLYYGDIGSNGIVGSDGKEYTIHGIRWAAESPNNRVYLRLDNPTITSSQSYTAYTSLFTSIQIGSTTLSTTNIVSGFTVNGGVAFYWNVPSNPFGSVGGVTNVLFSGVNIGPYGIEIYSSSGVLVLGSYDIAALYKASYTGSVSTNSGQKTLATNITATGVLTSDIAFIEDLYLDEVQKVSIPSNGLITYTSTIITDPTPSSWTSIYKITVISKGDT